MKEATVQLFVPTLTEMFLTFQISQKKLKKYEREYHTMREQQAQQEDPIERFEVSPPAAVVLECACPVSDLVVMLFLYAEL